MPCNELIKQRTKQVDNVKYNLLKCITCTLRMSNLIVIEYINFVVYYKDVEATLIIARCNKNIYRTKNILGVIFLIIIINTLLFFCTGLRT